MSICWKWTNGGTESGGGACVDLLLVPGDSLVLVDSSSALADSELALVDLPSVSVDSSVGVEASEGSVLTLKRCLY